MRILYHHRTLGDGAEGIHISAMVEAFRTLGHDVKVAALIGERTNVSTARTRLLEQVARRAPRPAYEALELGYNLGGYRMLMGHVRRWKPDIIYERYMLFNLAGLAAARRARIPLVLEVNAPLAHERETYERLALKGTAHRCERFVWSRADVAAVVSTPLHNYLVQHRVPAERIVMIPNGVDPETFRPDPEAREAIRARLGIAPHAVVVGFSGILRPWHGIELLLEAVARMDEARHRAHVLIVGDGPSRPDLERLAGERGLQGVVTFTGRVAHAEIPGYLAAFDIGVSPRATFYASPMKIPEYMAMGMAVVAPRMPNILDLVTDGVTGILFRPEDVSDVACALSALIGDPERRRQLAQNGRAAILAGGTWRHNAARIVGLLNGR